MALDIQDEIWTFLTTDHLGTPVMASDEAGQTLWQGGFEPFGRDYADARGAGIFLRLPGQWWDPVWEDAALGADVYYNVHRWYEYGTGRYTRVDPSGLLPDLDRFLAPQSLPADLDYLGRSFGFQVEISHLYTYAQQSPLVRFDPNGADLFDYLPYPLHCFWSAPACSGSSEDCKRRWSCFFGQASVAERSRQYAVAGVNSEQGFYFKVCLADIPSCQKAKRCPFYPINFPRPQP